MSLRYTSTCAAQLLRPDFGARAGLAVGVGERLWKLDSVRYGGGHRHSSGSGSSAALAGLGPPGVLLPYWLWKHDSNQRADPALPAHPAAFRSGLPTRVWTLTQISPCLGLHVYDWTWRNPRGRRVWCKHGDEDEQWRGGQRECVSQRSAPGFSHHVFGTTLCLSTVHVGARCQSGYHPGGNSSHSGAKATTDEATQPQIKQLPRPRKLLLTNTPPASIFVKIFFPTKDVCCRGNRWFQCHWDGNIWRFWFYRQ